MTTREGHSDLELAGIRFQIGMFEEALALRPNDVDALRYLAHAYAVVDRFAESLAADEKLVALLPRDARAQYNLACSYALNGRVEDAFGALHTACDLGFDDLPLLQKDRDLDRLRDDPRYRAVEARVAAV